MGVSYEQALLIAEDTCIPKDAGPDEWALLFSSEGNDKFFFEFGQLWETLDEDDVIRKEYLPVPGDPPLVVMKATGAARYAEVAPSAFGWRDDLVPTADERDMASAEIIFDRYPEEAD